MSVGRNRVLALFDDLEKYDDNIQEVELFKETHAIPLRILARLTHLSIDEVDVEVRDLCKKKKIALTVSPLLAHQYIFYDYDDLKNILTVEERIRYSNIVKL